MIDLCTSYFTDHCLSFNTKKSKVMIFGKPKTDAKPLTVDWIPLDFVNEWKYLGTTIAGGKSFSFTARPDISSFFRATNAVINVLTNAHEHTLLYLLHTNCVPILTYACEVKQYSASDMSDCNVAVNSAFRKIFGFTDWRSIRELRDTFCFESLYVIFKRAQDKFSRKCLVHSNAFIQFLATLALG